MKKLKIILFASLIALATSCEKYYGDYPFEDTKDQKKFKLIDVPNGAEDIGLNPTFTWEKAFDCSKCEVTYDVYLSTEDGPKILLAAKLLEPKFQVKASLQLATKYRWWVVARHDAIERLSELGIFLTRGLKYHAVTDDGGFSKRAGHSSAVFDDKMWVIAGYEGHTYEKDSWNSSDGIGWSVATSSAPFYGRSGHATAVFDGKLWVIGGYIGGVNSNDTWFSEDGITWTETTTPPFTGRIGHTAAVYDNKLWVIGGYGNIAVGGELNDVWYTSNGTTWTQATSGASFQARTGHTTVVYDDKLWVIGGRKAGAGFTGLENDVWFTSDGVHWSAATPSAAFSKRRGHTSVVYNNKMWVIGGKSETGLKNDIWSSSNGSTWTRSTAAAPFSTRFGHTTVVYNNKMWVIAGQQSNAILDRVNDVWTIE